MWETWRPPGRPQACVIENPCRGRCLHRPGNPAAAQTPAGGINPAPTARGRRPGCPGNHDFRDIANPCRGRCLHRPGNPAAVQTPTGGINPAPTAHGQRPGCPENHGFRDIATPCRGRCLHRPGNPAAAQTPAGGINPTPTAYDQRPANRNGRDCSGERRAGCPHPAGPGAAVNTPILELPRCGGRERPPYGTWETWRPPGRPQACVITNPCRGRFHIGPVCGGANTRGRGKSRPYGPRPTPGQPEWPRLSG